MMSVAGCNRRPPREANRQRWKGGTPCATLKSIIAKIVGCQQQVRAPQSFPSCHFSCLSAQAFWWLDKVREIPGFATYLDRVSNLRRDLPSCTPSIRCTVLYIGRYLLCLYYGLTCGKNDPDT